MITFFPLLWGLLLASGGSVLGGCCCAHDLSISFVATQAASNTNGAAKASAFMASFRI
jgi:hypothetical protein